MTTYQSIITPNLHYRTRAGLCLVMAQGITGAPAQNPSATAAANKTRFRHTERTMPRSVAVLWFDHYGKYGEPGREYWDNWGHVVVYVPGEGFASSSPNFGETSGPYWYPTIEAVERTFNATYRFWSEDINGLRVCQPIKDTTPPTKGLTVKHYFRDYTRARSINPGQQLALVDSKGKEYNCISGAGPYTLTGHVFGTGFKPGDSVDLWYIWSKDGRRSPHFRQTFVADAGGRINGNATFLRPADAGTAGYMWIEAAKTNSKAGTISRVASDAYLIV